MQTVNKQLDSRNRWWWFSLLYACTIEICLIVLYKMIGYLDIPMVVLPVAVEVFFVAIGAHLIMLSLTDR